MKKIFLTLFLFLAFAATTFQGCKKINDSPLPATLTLEKSIYKQLEVAVINAENLTLNSATYTGTVESAQVLLVQTQNKLAFMVPELPAGNYTLLTNIEGKDCSLIITIELLPAVTDAQAVINTVLLPAIMNDTQIDSVGAIVQQLNGDANWIQNKSILKNYYDDFNAKYNALPAGDKIQLAKILKANEGMFAMLPSLRGYMDTINLSYKTQTDYDYETGLALAGISIVTSQLQVLSLVTVTALAINSCVFIPNPITCCLTAAALACLAAKLYHHNGVVKVFLDKVFAPFLGILNDVQERSIIAFNKDQLYALNLSLGIRTLYNQDMSSANTEVQSMVTALNKSTSALNAGEALLPNQLNDQPAHISNKTVYQSKDFAYSGTNFSVTNISNPLVTLTSQDVVGEELRVKFTTNSNIDQSFTYDLNYNKGQYNISQNIASNLIVSNPCPSSTVTDIDGNIYNTVAIGNQCWMKENLKTTRYSDGSSITEVEDITTWEDIYITHSQVPAWCYYDGDAVYNATYGKLYNWYVVADPRNACPTGWHVPTDDEFTQLVDYLGGFLVAGGKMKALGLWYTPNVGADNSSGFTALPGGWRYNTGNSGGIGIDGYFWTATPNNSTPNTSSYLRYMNNVNTDASHSFFTREDGYSVRCVGD